MLGTYTWTPNNVQYEEEITTKNKAVLNQMVMKILLKTYGIQLKPVIRRKFIAPNIFIRK